MGVFYELWKKTVFTLWKKQIKEANGYGGSYWYGPERSHGSLVHPNTHAGSSNYRYLPTIVYLLFLRSVTTMTSRKLALSVTTIVIISALVGAGIYAYFSDLKQALATCFQPEL